MARRWSAISLGLFCAPLLLAAQPAAPGPAIELAAGARLELAVTGPVWAARAKPGDPLHAQFIFPVAQNGSIVIPAGTWVEGTIERVERPTWRTSRAELDILLTRIIFANGYVVPLPESSPDPASPAATFERVTIQASRANDLLLDDGAEMELTLAAPLSLESAQVAAAIPLSHPIEPGRFKSATMCRPTPGSPGSPGTPDTVIPGSPGTPSTTIPGGPGMPDITIPGSPATPPTVIPGSPGTPGIAGTTCPAPPFVLSATPIPPPSAQAQSAAAKTP